MNSDFLTVEQACTALKIGRTTFWKWRKAGIIKVVAIGWRILVPQSELVRLAESAK